MGSNMKTGLDLWDSEQMWRHFYSHPANFDHQLSILYDAIIDTKLLLNERNPQSDMFPTETQNRLN